MLKRNPRPMDATPGAAGGGDPAPAAAAPAAPAQAAAPASPAPTAPSSLLASGAPAPAPADPNAPSAAAGDWLPEKFRVLNGEALDVEASARKLAESYAGLEKRVGSGDVPPKSPDEYKVEVPEQFADVWDNEKFGAFKAEALAAGLTQKQLDFVLGKYFTVAPDLVAGGAKYDAETATAELRKTWANDAEFTGNINAAYKAFTAFAGEGDDMDAIGNNPVALRILAKVGKEMGEAGGIPAQATTASAESVDDLLRSPAYLDSKHQDHKAVSAKVQAHYAKKYGTAPAA